jgi:hypothetical protein
MVAISRAMTVGDFAIGNKKEEVTKQALRKIKRIKAYQVRRDFLNKLRAKGEQSQARKKQKISTFLPIDAEIMGENEYKRGCAFLLNWYNLRIAGSDN